MFPRSTEPVLARNPEAVRPFLDADPVGTAFSWFRIFRMADAVYVDGHPPRAVLSVGRLPSPAPFSFCTLHAVDSDAANGLLTAVPSGNSFFVLSEAQLLDVLKTGAREVHPRAAWLCRLDSADFADRQTHETHPVGPEWAGLIARLWEPDTPLEPYVRSRIEAGPTFGIYDGKELVAWYLTHLETDRVVITGFLHVLDPYRGRGYARSLTSAIVKEVFRRGKIPACHVYTDNVASLALKDSMGYRRVKRQVFASAVLG